MAPRTVTSVNQELIALRTDMLRLEAQLSASLDELPETRRASARNLLHYLALRRHDLRPLQEQLAAWGLSSFGRAEAQALEMVQAIADVLARLGATMPRMPARGPALLRAQTDALLGPPPAGRGVRIMVTMPDEAAGDFALVRNLVASGMDCARINCAYGDVDTWGGILRQLTRATAETARPCRTLIDLAGPKLRTGPLLPGPAVLRWRPRRDVYGRVVKPARIWLTDHEHPCAPSEPGAMTLPIAGATTDALATGDRLNVHDARDARRQLIVTERGAGGVWAECEQTAYIVPGTVLRRTGSSAAPFEGHVGSLPVTSQPIVLVPGDRLLLTPSLDPGRPAVRHSDGTTLAPAAIGLTLPETLLDVRPGQAIWFDDGKIGGTISGVTSAGADILITRADPGGSKLLGNKGINLPDTDLRLPALTGADIEHLPFIAANADIIGYSFIQRPADVRELQSRLAALGREQMPLMLKIETRRAFERLAAVLLAAMRSPVAGVMIARGDLAVECGYERLAEVQEEILALAEASHMPVIWATQVLERLAKDGLPSRAEITDAAMGERAECVMLNKGPYIVDAVRALDDILRRMQAHQHKRNPMLRHLRIADVFLDGV